MPTTTDTTYCTPAELAERIEEVRAHTHKEIAEEIGVTRSAVTRALSTPSTKHVKLLCGILRFYDIDARPDPHYPIAPN